MKTISLKELSFYLDNYFESEKFQDYAPNGLQVEGKENIQKIGVAVSASYATIEKAVSEKCDALITHHGLFWKGDSYAITGPKKRRLELLLKNQLSLLSYHLPMDAHKESGNNWLAAKDLGWKDLSPFGKINGAFIGVKGTFPQMHITELTAVLEAYYGHAATAVNSNKSHVKSGALISGGAYKEILTAAKEGIDVFITGNFDEPAFWDAQEGNIHFLAMGHYATEKVGPKGLIAHLQDRGFNAQFLDIPNPF